MHAEEYDVHEHRRHDEGETARQALHAREGAVSRARHDTQPQVLVPHALLRPDPQRVPVREPLREGDVGCGDVEASRRSQPRVAYEVPHLAVVKVVHRDLVQKPATRAALSIDA